MQKDGWYVGSSIQSAKGPFTTAQILAGIKKGQVKPDWKICHWAMTGGMFRTVDETLIKDADLELLLIELQKLTHSDAAKRRIKTNGIVTCMFMAGCAAIGELLDPPIVFSTSAHIWLALAMAILVWCS